MRPSSKVSPLPGHSVLLVDDFPHGSVARREMLREMGYTVTTALSGDEAMALIRTEGKRFHVVVTDYKMPGAIDGLALIGQIRELCPATRIVLLSGIQDILGMTEASSGADVVMAKCPGEIGHLARAIKSLLARKPVKKPAVSQQKAPMFMVKSS